MSEPFGDLLPSVGTKNHRITTHKCYPFHTPNATIPNHVSKKSGSSSLPFPAGSLSTSILSFEEVMNLSPEELRYISQTIFKHNTSPAKKLWPPEHHQDATANICIAPPACNPEEKWRRSLYANFGFQREDIVFGMEDQFCYWKIEEAAFAFRQHFPLPTKWVEHHGEALA